MERTPDNPELEAENVEGDRPVRDQERILEDLKSGNLLEI